MEYIALDIGTSFTKGAIVNVEELNIRSLSRRPSPSRIASDNPLYHELDPDGVVAGTKEIIQELSTESPNCSGILMTGQMGGLVLCDENGTAQRPYISWLDRRATADHRRQACSIFESISAIVGSRASTVFGNEFRPGLPLSFLYSLSENGDLSQYAGTIPVTLPDYVAAALCHAQPVMEWTGATGLLDVTNRCFPADLLTELGLDELSLPELVDFRHCVGECDVNGRHIPVYAATGDHQCSLAGTLLSDSELSINISTGSQVSMLTSDSTVGEFQIRPYFDGRLLKTITNIPAGRALTAIIKLLTEIGGDEIELKKAYQTLFNKAAATPESDVEVNLAFFPGAIEGPGSFQNLNEGNLTVGHLARACLNQMATYYAQLATRIDADRSWNRIAFSGGIAQMSELLREMVAEKIGSPYRMAATSEDSLMGMMILGRVIARLNDNVAAATDFVASRSE